MKTRTEKLEFHVCNLCEDYELLSVFIRKAVKMRIKQMQDEKCLISQGVLSGKLTPEENIESYNKAKENAKQMERPFKSFQKGGK